jgi:hypothetical protein
MSYKVEVNPVGSPGEWATNGLAFATEAEAKAYGGDLFFRWFGAAAYRVVESADPANRAWKDGEAVSL